MPGLRSRPILAGPEAALTHTRRDIHLIRHDDGTCRWEMAAAAPHPRLAGLVDGYQGYDERGTPFTRRHELPGLQAVVIINLGAPITIVDTAGFTLAVPQGGSFGAGLSDAYAVSESGGSQRGLQILFTPPGAGRFFRLPMRDLANRVFSLEDLLGPAAAGRLAAQLQAAQGWAACFALLDAAIIAALDRHRDIDWAGLRESAWALRRLAASDGRDSIAALAAELGRSRKHLAAGFREHVGLPPKTVARLLRFRQVLRLVDGTDAVNWGQVAQEAGYYDQAHFSHDFRAFTGRTPREYLAARQPGQLGLPVG
ncbi:helix-turn-helix domain-containing protein [Ferrovibrio sp.]|uniref:helix-turn-helix domain-containing protein n=1 Tax=Ferrovibrio sp. TaxID=1917215 RepID=UPI003511A865